MKKIRELIEDVMDFLSSGMLLFLVIPAALDIVVIMAYFGAGFENFFIINSTFVVNFIGLGAAAFYVVMSHIIMPVAYFIYDVVATAKMKRKKAQQ